MHQSSASSPRKSADVLRTKRSLRRARARRRSGGAVIFIVATTLGLLAVMGVYALSAATEDIRAAGNVKRAAQASAVADYGGIAAAEYLLPDKSQWLMKNKFNNPDMTANSSDTNCLSTQRQDPALPGDPKTTKACYRIPMTELQKLAWGNREPFTTQSFNHNATATDQLEGNVVVEVTNPMDAPNPPGYGEGLGFRFKMFTVTTFGITHPRGSSRADTVRLGRGRFVVGPIMGN